MQLLKILCLLFLFMISYDVISYLLLNKNEIQLSSKPGGDKINHAFDSLGSKLGTASKWIVGSGCLMCLFLLRLLFRRPILKLHDMSGDIMRGSPGNELDKRSRRESFLTCRISNTTLDTYTDDQTYDFPGQLYPEQLQVLLEELKFRTDEKFEGIDEWIEANEQDSKLCMKRLERIETELSYIRHQIFILMNNSSQIGSSLCIGESHETKEHVEALKDLSKILAQVKKQFQEDQYKVEIKESGDHEEDKVRGTADQDANEDNVGPGGDEQTFSERDHSDDGNDERVKDQLKKDVAFTESKQICNDEEVEKKYCQNQNGKMNDTVERKQSVSETKESDSSVLKSDLNDEESQETRRKFEASNNSDVVNDRSSINENKCASPRERIIPSSAPICDEQAQLFSTSTNSKTINSDEKDTTLINKKIANSRQYLSNESPSINLIEQTNNNQIETCNEKEIGLPTNLPPNKRTVRFANENPDESPLTHLENKRESSPTKQTDDSKMGSGQGVDLNRNRRESASCPLVEDKRPSRRNILERELSNLERQVSPSPVRQRYTRRNVRSKVADYIRGSK